MSRAEQNANIRLPLAAVQSGSQLPAVALSTLGSYQLRPSRSPIGRKNGERVNTIQGYLTRGVLPAEALKLLENDLRDRPIPLPQGYRYKFGGDVDARAGVIEDLAAPFGLVLALLIATIVFTFNSWRLSAVAFLVCACPWGLACCRSRCSAIPLACRR